MKAVIFDLGNVLLPYDHRRTVSAVASLCECDEKVVDELFHTLGDAIGTGALEATAFCHTLLVETGAPAGVTCDDLFDALCAGLDRDELTLAYAVELQQRPQVTVGVISNTNQIHVSWLDDHVPELAELDLVMMSNEVELLKPDPEIFLLALELLDVPPAQAIFIDDQPANVDAAALLGLRTLLHQTWQETRPAIEAWLAET